MIEFSESIGFWSKFTFWYSFINVFACLAFLTVVVVGGIFDLKFLFKALKQEKVDPTDDGRVISESTNGEEGQSQDSPTSGQPE
jgi:hypothetical protein